MSLSCRIGLHVDDMAHQLVPKLVRRGNGPEAYTGTTWGEHPGLTPELP